LPYIQKSVSQGNQAEKMGWLHIKGRLSEPPSVRGVTFFLRQLCQPNGLNFFSPTFKSRTIRPVLKFGTFLKPSGFQHEWCSHTYRTICTLPEH